MLLCKGYFKIASFSLRTWQGMTTTGHISVGNYSGDTKKNNAKKKSEKGTKVCPIKKSSKSQIRLSVLIIKPKLFF